MYTLKIQWIIFNLPTLKMQLNNDVCFPPTPLRWVTAVSLQLKIRPFHAMQAVYEDSN